MSCSGCSLFGSWFTQKQTANNLSTLCLEGSPFFFLTWSGVWIDGKQVVQDVGYNMQAATVFVALELSLFLEAV